MPIDTSRVEVITSPQNPFLKDVRRAALRGELTEGGYAVAESFHLLEEALRSDANIGAVLVAKELRTAVERHVRGLKRVRLMVLGDAAFAAVSSTETSQGVVTLVKPREWSIEDTMRGLAAVIVLDGIQDPGNAGTIVRSGEAFGATGVIAVRGTVSLFNPKTLRASAGSLFRLPFVQQADVEIARAILEQNRVTLFAAHPRAQKTITDADLSHKFALIVGAEGRGVSDRLKAGATELRIPTTTVESLNAATAAGVILYEASRQRTLHK
jgi:TrmH family RNA methyltransferase